jgi:hypothetical protein
MVKGYLWIVSSFPTCYWLATTTVVLLFVATQVDTPAQMSAMAVSGANSCKNRLLEYYQSNETLQHTYVMVIHVVVLQQSHSKKTYESRINCTRVLRTSCTRALVIVLRLFGYFQSDVDPMSSPRNPQLTNPCFVNCQM